MTLSREEIAVRLAASLLTGYASRGPVSVDRNRLACDAIHYADGLLLALPPALTPTPAPVAPPATAGEGPVTEAGLAENVILALRRVVDQMDRAGMVVPTDVSYAVLLDALRRFDAPTTPAPEAKRPTHVRVTKIADTGFDVAVGSVYEVVRWCDDGGGAVSPQVMADNGELVELAYVDHSDADYCPSWEPAHCPPPVTGSESKDEALRRAAERILDSASRLSRSARPLGVGGCGHSVHSGVLGEVESDIDDLRSALSRPVRP